MDVYANSLPLSKDVARTISLSGMLTLLRRNIWSIISYAIVISLAVFAITVTMPKTYTATGALIVEGDRFSIPEIDGALRDANTPDPMPKVRSEAQAIRSRQLLQGVIDSLDLAKDPEFNPSLYSSSPLAEARRALSLVLGSRTTPEEINQAVLDSVMRSLTVFQDNRSLVIDISFTSRDPELSAAFINTLIQHYTDGLAEARAKASRAANAVLWQQLNQTQVEIDGLEARIRRLRIDTGLVSLPAGSVGQQQLEELSVAAARAGVERARVETTWNQAKALTQENRPEELASVLESPTIARLRPLEGAAAQRLADLTARYGPRYVGLEGVRADLNAARQQVAEEARRIVASLGLQVEVARKRESEIEKQLEAARGEGVRTADAQAQLDELRQDVLARRTLYQALLQRVEQTAASLQMSAIPDIRVISLAAPPGSSSSPKVGLATALGAVGGAILGCFLCLMRVGKLRGFDSAIDVTLATGLPVLATLPRTSMRRGCSMLLSRVADADSTESAALRVLRTRLRQTGRAGVPRSVVFTSAGGGLEASSVAAAFARVAACDGDRVLLIEGDLQKPRLNDLLHTGAHGLIHVLEAKASWREMLTRDSQAPLDLLLNGGTASGSPMLLSSTCLQNLLIESGDFYTLVVLAAPPVTNAFSSLTLADRADATILVVDGATATPDAAKDAAKRLLETSGNPVTAVLIET